MPKPGRILLLLCTLLFTVSCTASRLQNSPYLGRWNAVAYHMMGLNFTVEVLGKTTLTLRENGKADLVLLGEASVLDWDESESGIQLRLAEEEIPCTVKGEHLQVEYPYRGDILQVELSRE